MVKYSDPRNKDARKELLSDIIEVIRELNRQYQEHEARSSDYVTIKVRIPADLARSLDQMKYLQQMHKSDIITLALQTLFTSLQEREK